MRLFHWNRLTTCANYATGDAVVMAPDLETARATLRDALRAWAAENREWQWTHGEPEDRAAIEARIEADVATDPHAESEAPAAVVIRGSE